MKQKLTFIHTDCFSETPGDLEQYLNFTCILRNDSVICHDPQSETYRLVFKDINARDFKKRPLQFSVSNGIAKIIMETIDDTEKKDYVFYLCSNHYSKTLKLTINALLPETLSEDQEEDILDMVQTDAVRAVINCLAKENYRHDSGYFSLSVTTKEQENQCPVSESVVAHLETAMELVEERQLAAEFLAGLESTLNWFLVASLCGSVFAPTKVDAAKEEKTSRDTQTGSSTHDLKNLPEVLKKKGYDERVLNKIDAALQKKMQPFMRTDGE